MTQFCGHLMHAPSAVQQVGGDNAPSTQCSTCWGDYPLLVSAEQQTAILCAGSAEDKARMHLLRRCCSLFQGNHPFHNYTKRRLYRIPEAPPRTGTLCSMKQRAVTYQKLQQQACCSKEDTIKLDS